MRLAMLVAAATLVGQELDEKILRLIGPDATVVYGVNAHRYRNSKLHGFNPLRDGEIESAVRDLRQLIVVACRYRCGDSLTIFRGDVAYAGLPGVTLYREVPVMLGHAIAFLDSTTGVIGDSDRVKEAIGRWRSAEVDNKAVADAVRKASGSYDNWIVALDPLERFERGSAEGTLDHWESLAKTVREVRGGIRFGAMIDVHVEVTAGSVDDAVGLAALGRWLPGLLQAKGNGRPEMRIVNLIENFAVEARGTSAALSFSISEARLEELAATMNAESSTAHQ
jgi:hypothetical protein